MEKILFLNTSGAKLQIALSIDGKVDSYIGEEDAKRHNYVLLEVLDKIFIRNGITAKELTHIVCVSGPGSFTGIRVGASFANALCRSTGAKLVSVTSLEFVGRGDRIVSLDCKHGNYYILREENAQKTYEEWSEARLNEAKLPHFAVTENTLAELVAYGTELVFSGTAETDLIRPFYLKKSSAEREFAEREHGV